LIAVSARRILSASVIEGCSVHQIAANQRVRVLESRHHRIEKRANPSNRMATRRASDFGGAFIRFSRGRAASRNFRLCPEFQGNVTRHQANTAGKFLLSN
jgi:hypothetical protein